MLHVPLSHLVGFDNSNNIQSRDEISGEFGQCHFKNCVTVVRDTSHHKANRGGASSISCNLQLGKESLVDSCSYEHYVLFCCVELTLDVYIDLSDTPCIGTIKKSLIVFYFAERGFAYLRKNNCDKFCASRRRSLDLSRSLLRRRTE